jgi:O-antigen ligase
VTDAADEVIPARRESTSSRVINPGHRSSRFLRQLGRPLVSVVGLALAALLAQSFFWSPNNPAALKVVVAGTAVLAAAKPGVALLILAATIPFGRIISNVTSPAGPVAITEALVLAYLAGWGWSRLHRRVADAPASPAASLGYLFAAVVVASLFVDIGVLRYWKDYWQPFIGQLLAYLGRDYLNIGVETRPWASGLGGLASVTVAACFLEGLGIAWVVRVLCVRDSAFGRKLLMTLTLAAVAAACLSLQAALELAKVGNRGVLAVLQTDRVAAHTLKINTAASYFVLFIPVLVGLATGSARTCPRTPLARVLRWTVTTAGAGLLLTAMWLTGTRAAMTAGILVAVGASAYAVVGGRLRSMTWRSAVIVVIACGLVSALLGLGFYMRMAALEADSATRRSLPVRVLMWRAALKTLAAHPVVGVGIGQFQYRVADFDPDAVSPANVGSSRFHAHNQFLEMAAEVGVIGGLLFLGMFAATLWRAWKKFRSSHDPVLGGTIAGVMAFLITCLGGQPLFYDVVALPFWMVLGVALAAGEASPASISAERAAAGSSRSRLVAGFLIIVALSIPVRVWQGKDRVNFALAKYGFSGWHHPNYGRPYRLIRDDGTFFTYPQARSLTLPIRRDVAAGRNLLEVDVSLDGRRARTLTLADDEWQRVELMIPADSSRRFRRIDIAVRAPAGVTGQVRVAAPEISNEQTVGQDRSR